MRLDKWLKESGLIPRRQVAKEACDAGRVRRNGRPAQAADAVALGDQIAFDLGRGAVTVEVLDVPVGSVAKADRETVFRRISGPVA